MNIYVRADWGSTLPPGGYPMAKPVDEAYVHHYNSGIESPTTLQGSMSRVRGAQQYHASLGWSDIGYSWLVDNMGNVFEGRGWNHTGAHTYGWNSKGYGICWLGDSNVSPPSDKALAAIAEVIKMGISEGWISPNPTIVAHRDRVPDTSCCGDVMYGQLGTIRELVSSGGGVEPEPEPEPEPKPKPKPYQKSKSMLEREATVYSIVQLKGQLLLYIINHKTDKKMELVEFLSPDTVAAGWPSIQEAIEDMYQAGSIVSQGAPHFTQMNWGGLFAYQNATGENASDRRKDFMTK